MTRIIPSRPLAQYDYYHIAAQISGPLPDGSLELFLRDITALEDDLAVDLNRGELGQGRPLDQAEGGLLDDLDVKPVFLFQFRDHGTDVVSPSALRVVEVEFDKHVQPPVRCFCMAIWGIVTSVKTSDNAE